MQEQYIDPQMYPLPADLTYDQKYRKPPEDLIETYGSIIKDLTDTEKALDNFELRLKGKMLDPAGHEVLNPDISPKMSPSTATEFVDMLRSIVNQNTHFTNFDKIIISNVLMATNYNINRWLMFQGSDVPLRYRSKIAFEAMNLVNASLHKSLDGTILEWTKGSFAEGVHRGQPQQKRNIFDTFMPWNKR